MSRNDFETRSLVVIVLAGYVLNLLFGWIGVLFPGGSIHQVLLYQVGNAFAISGSKTTTLLPILRFGSKRPFGKTVIFDRSYFSRNS